MAGEIFIGTTGYRHNEWQRGFYPRGLDEKRWLHFYAEKLNLVEMNTSFNHDIEKSEAQRWYEETGSNFRFVLHGSHIITHQKGLVNVESDAHTFFDHANDLKEKWAITLW